MAKKKPKAKNPHAQAMRALGVKKTSPKRRAEIARNAAQVRHAKRLTPEPETC